MQKYKNDLNNSIFTENGPQFESVMKHRQLEQVEEYPQLLEQSPKPLSSFRKNTSDYAEWVDRLEDEITKIATKPNQTNKTEATAKIDEQLYSIVV